MSKALSLKLKDEVFQEAETICGTNHRPRNAYFNDAISLYNQLWKRKLLKKRLKEESALIAENSLEVLQVFEQVEDNLGG